MPQSESTTLPACYYCGLIATTTDHVRPRHLRDRMEFVGGWRGTETVPACRECNVLIGARWFGTITARKQFLKDKLRRRYAHELRIPAWSEAELAQLGPIMRGEVLAGLRRQHIVRQRLAW
jgi:hypothetical protein